MRIEILSNFGKVPRCYDFSKENKQNKYYFILNQCNQCSVIQLKETGKKKSYIPKLKWIRNKEPDGHLKNLIFFLKNKIKEKKKILLISNFDKKIYDSLNNKKNINYLKLLDSKKHLNILKSNPNQFQIQDKIIQKNFIKKIKHYGKFDIILSCRVLEHTYNLALFIKSLEILLKPNGNFIFEIPDSKKSLHQGDIAMIWEEHPLYFTKESFSLAFKYLGYKILQWERYQYPQEDALVFRIKKHKEKKYLNKELLNKNINLGKLFIKNCLKRKKKLITFLTKKVLEKKEIAIFGAGHRSVVYFHAFKLKPYINYIFDDDIKKKNLYFPGTNLKIKPSSVMLKRNIDICFLSLNIDKEKKIINKLKKYNNKTKFFSISPDSKIAF